MIAPRAGGLRQRAHARRSDNGARCRRGHRQGQRPRRRQGQDEPAPPGRVHRAVRVTSNWLPGSDVATERGSSARSETSRGPRSLSGVRVYVSVYHPGSKTTPLEPRPRPSSRSTRPRWSTAVPSFDDVIVGNEPNLNRFWLPQFGLDGTNASAPAYLAAARRRPTTRSRLADPQIRDLGRRACAARVGPARTASARRARRPRSSRRGRAYRASGRTTPVMDGFAIHPYPENVVDDARLRRTRRTPRSRSPTTTSSSPCSAQAFDGTAQAGSTLPILYDEFGIESVVPTARRRLYSGTEATRQAGRRERPGGAYYRGPEARVLPAQRHRDAPLPLARRDALASGSPGVYYADGTPKASLSRGARRVRRARGGSITRCEGLALDVEATQWRSRPTPGSCAAKRIVSSAARSTASGGRVTRVSTQRQLARQRGYGRGACPRSRRSRAADLGTTPVAHGSRSCIR